MTDTEDWRAVQIRRTIVYPAVYRFAALIESTIMFLFCSIRFHVCRSGCHFVAKVDARFLR
jgi:hypothetical protein